MTIPSTYTKITFPSTNDAVIVPTESNNLNIANVDVPPINTKFINMGVVNPFDNKLIQTILTVSQNVAKHTSTTQLNIHKTTGDGFNLFVGDKVILLTKAGAIYNLTITQNFTNQSTALNFNAVIFDTPIGDGAIITISQSDQFNEGNRKTRGEVAGFTISPSTITKNGIGISNWFNDPTFNVVDNTTLPTSQAVKEYVLSKKNEIETKLSKVNDGVINKSAFLHDDGLRFTRISDGSETGQINYDGVDTITFNSNGGSSTAATRLDFQVNSASKMVIDNEGDVGIGTTNPKNKLDIVGSLGRGVPITKTQNFTVSALQNWLIVNGTSIITVNLPGVSNFSGREIMIKNIAAFAVISNATNVIGLNNNQTTNSILPAIAGSWCVLVSNGSKWVKMSGSA